MVKNTLAFLGILPCLRISSGEMRHSDHRFEWTRAEFRALAAEVAERFGYEVRHLPVGTDDPEVGPPTQMAIFDRVEKER